jgi:hypothetical protein
MRWWHEFENRYFFIQLLFWEDNFSNIGPFVIKVFTALFLAKVILNIPSSKFDTHELPTYDLSGYNVLNGPKSLTLAEHQVPSGPTMM